MADQSARSDHSGVPRTVRLNHRPTSITRSNKSSSSGSVGNNNGSSESAGQAKRARTPRTKTQAGDRLEEIDRPIIVPRGILWEKHPYNAREPSTVQGALVRQMYPEPIGPAGDRKPVLCWEDYKWSPGVGVTTAASKIVEEFWWRFKCDPSNQETVDAALEMNFTNKVRQMLHEEKATAIKRLNKKKQMRTEVDEEGNNWPTKEALISARPPDFGTAEGWRLLCEHWSSAAFRKKSLTNKKKRLARGETVFPCSGARSAVSTRQHLKLKTGKDPGIAGAWQHMHNLHRFTDQEKICSQRTSEHWDKFDDAMKNVHGENWQEEHPELDAQIIFDAAGRMPHGRLGISNELFIKTEKSKIKSRRPFVSQPVRSAREEHLQRANDRLQRENKRFRGFELVMRSLAEKGGVDYDAIMQSADLATSDSEVGCEKRRDADCENECEKGMGSNNQGSPSRENNHAANDNTDDIYDNDEDGEGYNYGEGDDDGYGHGYNNDYVQDGYEDYDNYGEDY